MSRMREELQVIPLAVRVIAVILLVCVAGVLASLAFIEPREWMVAGIILPFFGVWVLAVGYVYGDARRRGMRYVMWTLLATFIPNAIGFILYFIMRDPLMKNCSICGKAVRGEFAFCPECGGAIAPSCPSCKHAIEPGWSHCPRCGRGLLAA